MTAPVDNRRPRRRMSVRLGLVAGSIGFTAQMKVLRCAAAAADPWPRWRTP